jgi:hypothetical protein
MGVFSDVGNYFSNMGTGIVDVFSSSDQEEIQTLCGQLISLKSRVQQFQGTLNVFGSELDKINALLAEVQQEIASAIDSMDVPTAPMAIQAQRIQLTLGFGMSVSGLLFLGSMGAGRVVTSNMQELEQLIARPGQVELTAADIATLNADIATTTTNILKFTQIANVLKVLGAVTAVATVIITMIQAASFGEQMKEEIQTLQTNIAQAKSDIAAAVAQLQAQKPAVLRLASVVSGGLPAVGSSQPTATGIVVDPNDGSTSDAGQLIDDMVSLLTNIDEEDNGYQALNTQVSKELQQFNKVFPDCLTQVKAQLETLQSNVISAVKLLANNVPATVVQQALSLTPPLMTAIQAAATAGILTASSQVGDFSLQLLANDTIQIVAAKATSNPNVVVSTGGAG